MSAREGVESQAPEDIQGTHRFRACGQRSPCADKAAPAESVDTTITIDVTQDANDPTTGTVRVTGSGNALVDGRVLPATFRRQRFTAYEKYSNLPSTCPEEHTLMIGYDFEGFGGRELTLEEMATPDCGASAVYCKGSLSLTLSPPDGADTSVTPCPEQPSGVCCCDEPGSDVAVLPRCQAGRWVCEAPHVQGNCLDPTFCTH
jgi:hypothetical protein